MAGAGTLTLSGTTASTYTGATSANSGTLNVNYANAAGTLLAPTSTLTLGGGTIAFIGKSGAVTTQTLGNLSLTAGASTLTLTPVGGGSMALTLGNAWTRSAGAEVNITGAGTLTSSPSLTNSGTGGGTLNGGGGTIIGGYAVFAGTTFATVSGGNISGLTYTAGQTNQTSWASANQTYTSSTVVSATQTANSVSITGAATITLSGTNTITSGGILLSSTAGNFVSTITGGTLAGPNNGELILQSYDAAGSTANLVVNSAIGGGSNALTIAGPGKITVGGAVSLTAVGNTTSLYLNPTASAADSITGGIAFAGTSNIINFQSTSTGATTISGGTVALSGNLTINDLGVGTGGLTISAPITAAGNITVTGTGTSNIALSGAITFAGAATILDNLAVPVAGTPQTGVIGTLTIGGGAGTVTLGGATIFTNNAATLLTVSAPINAGNKAITINGNSVAGTLFSNTINSSGATITNSSTGIGSVTLGSFNLIAGTTTINQNSSTAALIVASPITGASGTTLAISNASTLAPVNTVNTIVNGLITFNGSGSIIVTNEARLAHRPPRSARRQRQHGGITVNSISPAPLSITVGGSGLGVTTVGASAAILAGANVTEAGAIVTVTAAANTFVAGQQVVISGVATPGYNGTFTIITATAGNFTYFDTPGLYSAAFFTLNNALAATAITLPTGANSPLNLADNNTNVFYTASGVPLFTVAGVINGSNGIVVGGSAITAVTGLNNYTGGTTINSGILQIVTNELPAMLGGNLGAIPVVATANNVTLNGGTLPGVRQRQPQRQPRLHRRQRRHRRGPGTQRRHRRAARPAAAYSRHDHLHFRRARHHAQFRGAGQRDRHRRRHAGQRHDVR